MKKIFKLLFRWSFLIAYGIAWLICHGWAFAGVVIGPAYEIHWLTVASVFWTGLILMPNGLGFLIPIPLAFFFQRIFFPRDEHLKQDLKDAVALYKKDLKLAKEKRQADRAARKEARRSKRGKDNTVEQDNLNI